MSGGTGKAESTIAANYDVQLVASAVCLVNAYRYTHCSIGLRLTVAMPTPPRYSALAATPAVVAIAVVEGLCRPIYLVPPRVVALLTNAATLLPPPSLVLLQGDAVPDDLMAIEDKKRLLRMGRVSPALTPLAL